MADHPRKDLAKDLETPDALAAIVAQQNESPPAADTTDVQPSDKSDSAESHSIVNEKSHRLSETHDDNELTPTRTNATDVSVGTTATGLPPQEEKTWKQKLNPLRWGNIPKIPQERIVSREYGAGFFSQLFFNWMTPLMTVS